jgi:hypothetical protein
MIGNVAEIIPVNFMVSEDFYVLRKVNVFEPICNKFIIPCGDIV